ncbi:hypothetical protein [Haladaptatus sp. NG-WS-4]
MDKRLTVARRELASLRSEKTIVLAILIQLFVAAFSSFLAVGLVSLYDPGSVSGGVGMEVAITGEAGEDIAPIVREHDGLRAVEYSSQEAAMTDFRSGGIHAILHVERTDDGRARVRAITPDGNIRYFPTDVRTEAKALV